MDLLLREKKMKATDKKSKTANKPNAHAGVAVNKDLDKIKTVTFTSGKQEEISKYKFVLNQ